MMTFTDAITYILSGGSGWLFLLWWGIALIFSVMLNHQDIATKRLNTAKAFGFGFFWTVTAMTSLVANGDNERLYLPVVLSLGTIVIVVAADWLGFLLRHMAFHQGGLQGWAWEAIAILSGRLQKLAESRYQESAHPKFEKVATKKPARSKAKKIGPMLTLLLLLAACRTDYVTATPSPGPSPTLESSPTATAPAPTITVPTQTPSVQPTAPPAPTRPPAENLLLCWGFECPWQYDTRHPTGGLKVPLGWTAFWSQSVPDDWTGGIPLNERFCGGFVPAVELEFHPPHVREGASAGRVIQSGRNCPAGLYQTVDVTAGATYIASGFVFNWSTNEPVVDSPSTSYIRSWLGVDPLGGIDPFAPSVVWGNEESAQDAYRYVEVEARAISSKVTVFVLSIPNFAVARSDTFIDDMSLLQSGPPSIVELPPTPISDQLGTIVYDTITNLRVCDSALWNTLFDPTYMPDGVNPVCPYSEDENRQRQIMDVGYKAGVIKWVYDRYGNTWARYRLFEDLTSQTSVACYKGAPRGEFYSGVQVGDYDGLAASGKLPPAQNPCSIR